MHPAGCNMIGFTGKVDLDFHVCFFALVQPFVKNNVLDAGNEIFCVIGFGDKVIRPALQPPDDIFRTGNRG